MRVLPALVIVLLCSSPAFASPVTFRFAGTVGNPLLPEIPVGTSADLHWTFDPNEPDFCTSGTSVGAYQGQSATVLIASTVGPLTYQATGFLLSNGRLTSGCAVAVPDVELRLPYWTGPSLPTARLYPGALPFPGGLFWFDPSLDGGLPMSQPQSVLFFMQPFLVQGSVNPVTLMGQFSAVPVHAPEPSTWLLLGTGLAATVLRFRSRRGK